MAGGILAGCLVVDFIGSPALSVIVTAGFSALLPDIDTQKSSIQRYFPFIGKILGVALKHRGITHSLIFPLFLVLLINFLALPGIYALAFLAGFLSHLVLDTFTPSGVPWLWPLPLRFSIPFCKSDSLLEKILILPVMWFLAGYKFLQLF